MSESSDEMVALLASSWIVWGAVTAAATVAAALSVAQSDAASRRLLTPRSLAAKRLASYHYSWNESLLRQTRCFYQFEQASVSLMTSNRHHGSSDTPNDNGDSPLDWLLTTEEEIEVLIGHVLSKTSSLQRFRVVRIGRDEHRSDATSNSNSTSDQSSLYFAWLVYETSPTAAAAAATTTTPSAATNTAARSRPHLVQVPLIAFGLALARALDERYISTVTLCFVWDAAGGQAADCLSGLFAALPGVDCERVPRTNPAWLIQWALLHQQVQLNSVHQTTKTQLSLENLERSLYAFCRLATIPVPHQPMQTTATTLVTIPTAIVPLLLPILHTLFPHDRHVFAYTGCVSAVATATSQLTSPTWQSFGIPTRTSSTSTSTSSTPTKTTSSTGSGTPTNANLSTQLMGAAHNSTNAYLDALAAVPVSVAAPTECWMAAVDAVLVRKRDVPEYVPYMCKLDYLISTVSAADDEWKQSSSYWATRSLYQYVTGSASRDVPVDVMDTARGWLHEYFETHNQSTQTKRLIGNSCLRRGIENIVFAHKLILIANKTLVDTVAPAEHWTLKQALKRGGCACCMIDDDDDDDAVTEIMTEMSVGTNRLRQRRGDDGLNASDSLRGIVSATSTSSRGYVDGSSVFAFDPTQFT